MSEIDSTAEQICVGDIIVLTEDDVVPCDAVILSTSNDSHQVIKSYLPCLHCVICFHEVSLVYSMYFVAIFIGLRNDSKLGWRDKLKNKVCFETYSRFEDG